MRAHLHRVNQRRVLLRLPTPLRVQPVRGHHVVPVRFLRHHGVRATRPGGPGQMLQRPALRKTTLAVRPAAKKLFSLVYA